MSGFVPRLGAAPGAPFPDPERALREPNGLLAWGGDLSCGRLIAAYRHGIFPWFSEGEPILWWSPDPRCVFRTDAMHLPKRLARALRTSGFSAVADTRFEAVIDACATPRKADAGTWIVPAMRAAYVALHRAGHAHSIEVERDGELVGGLYGVAIGGMFCAESMYSAVTNGSKFALLALAARLGSWGFPLIDAQVESAHLLTLGAITMPRPKFLARLSELATCPEPVGNWRERFGRMPASELAQR
jgi:leucyl/phenylalanyl-tRNA--protein transferase